MSNRQPLLSLLAVALVTSAVAAFAEQPAWVSRGPDDVGFITSTAAADGVAYAGTAAGIYRSTPSGQGWELAGLPTEQVWSVVARPGSPVYVITAGGGLLVSRDHGDSWDRLAENGSALSSVAIDPEEPAAAYLTNVQTLWKTTDAGASWSRVRATNVSGFWIMAFDPRDNALVVHGYDSSYVWSLYRSTDGGETFTALTIPGQEASDISALAGGSASGNLYVAGFNFFCRTADSGATWTCSATGASFNRIVEVPAASSNAPAILVAASDRGLLVSADGGATWSRAGGPLATTTYASAVAFDDVSGAVLGGTQEGIYRSADRGTSWSWHGSGLRSSVITALAPDPTDSAHLLASATGYGVRPGWGLFGSSDAGQSWSPVQSTTGPAGFSSLVFDPADPSTLYGAANGGLFSSDDAGETWRTLSPGNMGLRQLAIDPRSPATLWASGGLGLQRVETRGGPGSGIVDIPQEVYSLVFDSHDPATLYAGSHFDFSGTGYWYYYTGYPAGGSIFVSRDMGATWGRGDQNLGSFAYALAADPFVGGGVYAGTSGNGVLRSDDGGATWVGSGSGWQPPGVTALIADPVRSGRLYALGGGTVYRSLDFARTWEPFAEGLGSPGVTALAITPDGRRLVAGTNGAGNFDIELEAAAAPSFPCAAAPGRLCLAGGRYAVEVLARRRSTNVWDPGTGNALNDRSGYFGFPASTGDPNFPEVVVKMLGPGALGPGGPGIFHASLTTLPYILTVTDTVTGLQRIYGSNSASPLCGGADRPFPGAPPEPSPVFAAASAQAGALSLLGGRFSVTLQAHNPRTGQDASGSAIASGDRFGFFGLPEVTGDPELPEVVVKMVDFTAITGKFWFFHTGLTGFDYTLTVTDSTTGAVRTYGSPGNFCGAADTEAFAE